VSPKRNAQRRAFNQIFEQFRRNNTKLDGLTNERNINDGAFEEYPALGDLFYVVYDDLCKDGGNQIEKMSQAAESFNRVIQRVFPHYALVAEWNRVGGTPNIELIKNGRTKVPLEGLSLGEQEILSLATNIFSSRDRYDVFLIDEPEVHLNWHLEERLFEFFDDFCAEYGKQLIAVTHSRVIFKQKFYPKSQFLYWNSEGSVSVAREVTAEQRRRIAGDAIEIVRLGAFRRPTIFVEDGAQERLVTELAEVLAADVAVSECANKANLRSLYRLSSSEGGWPTAYFVEDGDNEGCPFPQAANFIHLDKYCIETYLLDVPTTAIVAGLSEEEIRVHLLESVLANREKIFKRNKFFEFLVDQLCVEHLTPENIAKLDASEVLPTLLIRLGLSERDYVRSYIAHLQTTGRTAEVLPARLVCILQSIAESQRTSCAA
jgi:hypothetical protein